MFQNLLQGEQPNFQRGQRLFHAKGMEWSFLASALLGRDPRHSYRGIGPIRNSQGIGSQGQGVNHRTVHEHLRWR